MYSGKIGKLKEGFDQAKSCFISNQRESRIINLVNLKDQLRVDMTS